METWLKECRETLMDGGVVVINNRLSVDQSDFNNKFFDVSNRPEYLKASFNAVIEEVINELLEHHFEEAMKYKNQQDQDEAAIAEHVLNQLDAA